MGNHLRSRRLLLRPLRRSDLDWCTEMLTDREVMHYISGDEAYTEAQVLAELPYALQRGGGGCIGIWAIVEQASVRCLGTVFLLPLPVEEDDTNWSLVGGDTLPDCEIELGFVLRKFAWGNGVATEAATRLLRFAFEEARLPEVVAVIDPRNRASRNVLTKVGFTDEGPRRAYAQQCPGFRITRDDWLNRRASHTAS